MKTYTLKAYIALILDEIEEYEELIKFLSTEIDKSPNNVVLLNNRSLAFSEIGKTTEGFKDIKAAYDIDPENKAVAYNYNRLKEYLEKT